MPFPLKSSRPLPSRSARHPPPKWGWARKTWRRGAINPKLASPRSRGGGGPRLYLKSCLPPLAGGEEDHEVVEGGAPSGRCLRSGHKNSVKGKGAIKHKGVPTIIYHCTAAPFRLAPLATHLWTGVGKGVVQTSGFRLAAIGYRLSDFGFRLSAIGFRRAFGNPPLATAWPSPP